jgi:LysR family transcriptional regulator, low CO2-responsive transcriptional regulator
MNIDHIECFVFVALTGSFSRAANLLHLSQPTVSLRIKSLETDLGYKLFQRTGNTSSLTEEGDIFLPYAKNMLQSLQKGQQAMRRNHANLDGELSISSVFGAALYLLPNMVEQFQQIYPKVKLNIFTGHSHQVLDMVLNHEVSFGIARAVNHSLIDRVQLMKDEMILTVYPDHPFQNLNQVTIEDVAKERLILFNRGSLDWKLINGAFSHFQLENNVIMEVDNIEVVKRMVKQKLGIAFLPRISIQRDLELNKLQVVEVLNLPQLNRNYELIYLKDTSISKIMACFIDFLWINPKT